MEIWTKIPTISICKSYIEIYTFIHQEVKVLISISFIIQLTRKKIPLFFAENMLGRRFIREKCRHCKCLKKYLHMIMDSTLINFDRIEKIIVYPTLGFYYGSNSWISLCSLFIFALLSTASKPTTSNLVLVSS